MVGVLFNDMTLNAALSLDKSSKLKTNLHVTQQCFCLFTFLWHCCYNSHFPPIEQCLFTFKKFDHGNANHQFSYPVTFCNFLRSNHNTHSSSNQNHPFNLQPDFVMSVFSNCQPECFLSVFYQKSSLAQFSS